MAAPGFDPFRNVVGVGWPSGLVIPYLIRVEVSDTQNLTTPPSLFEQQHTWFHFGLNPAIETRHIRLTTTKRRNLNADTLSDRRRFATVVANNSSDPAWAAYTITNYPGGWPPLLGDDWLWPSWDAINSVMVFFSVGTELDDNTSPLPGFTDADRIPLADARADFIAAGSPVTGAPPVNNTFSPSVTIRTTLTGAGPSGADIIYQWNNEVLTIV